MPGGSSSGCATRPSGDVAVAPEDLAAEAWLTAAQKIADFRGTGEQFAGWLFGIARNLAANAQRRACGGTRTRRPSPTPSRPGAGGPGTGAGGAGLGQPGPGRACRARERDVVACIDVVGLDVESTARALDISAVAVRVARHRGLARLRRHDRRGSSRTRLTSSTARG